MVAAYGRLPASAHNGEVVLPTEELLRLASKAIAEVCLVDMPIVQSETFPVEANRPGAEGEVGQQRRKTFSHQRKTVNVLDVGLHPGLGEDEGIGLGRYDDVQGFAEGVGGVL